MTTKLLRDPTVALALMILLAMVAGSRTAIGAEASLSPKQQVLWDRLSREVASVEQQLDGVLGVAILDLNSGQQLLIHPDEVFPQASSIKIVVLAELYRQAAQASRGVPGNAGLQDRYVVTETDLVPDSAILGGLTPGVTTLTVIYTTMERDMTTFETDGFLSTEILEYEKAISVRYAKKIGLTAETNRLIHQVIYSIKPRSKHAPDLLLAALLTRQAGTFQSIVILLRSGLETQSQVLLRNLAEMMFITGAIRKDDTFVERYVLAEEVGRLKALEAIVRDKNRRHEEVDANTSFLIGELRTKIKRDPPETFTTERIAGIADLSSYYDNVYRYTSMAVHCSPRELNTAFVVNADGDVVSMRYEPEVDDLDMCFDFSITIMLYTLHETASHFGLLELVRDIENLQQVNQQLAGPVGTQPA